MRPRGLSYSAQLPPPPLAGLLDYFWSLSDALSHSRERMRRRPQLAVLALLAFLCVGLVLAGGIAAAILPPSLALVVRR